MQYKEIEAMFSARVAKCISEGYTICTATMSGSQGEIAKVNFYKGGEHFSLYLENKHCFRESTLDEKIVMRWVRSNELHGDVLPSAFCTFWLGEKHCTTLEESVWYKAGKNWYVGEEEAVAIHGKRVQRYRNEDNDELKIYLPMTNKGKRIAAKIFNTHKIRTVDRVKVSEITEAYVCAHPRGVVEMHVKTETSKYIPSATIFYRAGK